MGERELPHSDGAPSPRVWCWPQLGQCAEAPGSALGGGGGTWPACGWLRVPQPWPGCLNHACPPPHPTLGPGRNRNPASLLCDLRAQRTPLSNPPRGPCGETGPRLSFRLRVVSSLLAWERHAWGPGGLHRPCLWRAGGGVALSLGHQPGLGLLPPCGCPGPSAWEHPGAPVPGSVRRPSDQEHPEQPEPQSA